MHSRRVTIERVLSSPGAPARRFGAIVDTVITLAVGSVCACALTLGPAPLNTVAAGAATAAASHSRIEPVVADLPLIPDAVPSAAARAAQTDPRPQPQPTVSADPTPPVTQPPNAPPPPAHVAPEQRSPAMPDARVTAPAASAAVAIVENHRTASGLDPFVSADACEQPSEYVTVVVTPPQLLPPGMAKKSLAPDPAYAAADGAAPGVHNVTVYTCAAG